MNKKIVLAGLLLSFFTFTACNNGADHKDAKEAANDQNEDKKAGMKEDDSKFMTEAASGGMMEVSMGKLAATNAANPRVKEFGQQMVDDHTKANEELKNLAGQKQVTLPAVPDNDKQKKIDDLAQKKGADFDKAYIDLMVDDHEEDVDHFQHAADHADDADLKAWAAGKVPVLQHHLDMAKSVQDELKKTK